jgi:hypothetical protein
MAKKPATSAELKRTRANALIAAATKALALPIAKIAGFKNANAFKAQLVRSLGVHPEFEKAAHDLHALHAAKPGPKASKRNVLKTSKGRGRSLYGVRPHGRVQATRFEGGRRAPKG